VGKKVQLSGRTKSSVDVFKTVTNPVTVVAYRANSLKMPGRILKTGQKLRDYRKKHSRLGIFYILNLLSFSLILQCSLAVTAESQQLYTYRQGRSITYTTIKPQGKNYSVVSPRKPKYSSFAHLGVGYRWTAHPVSSKYDELIKQLAKRHNLEAALVKAVIHVESAFNKHALSPKGAMGLMQLMPGTARRFGVDDAYNPIENMMGGTRYLRWLFDHFKGNIYHVLAGYNAGEGAVQRYKGIPPYSETRMYVSRVMRLRDLYQSDYDGRKTERG
jgi:hypothetical protein